MLLAVFNVVGMVYIDCEIEQIDLAAALDRVSPQRRSHALRYRREHDQRLSVAAYMLLQKALKEEYGIDEPPLFEAVANGKPSIVGRPDIYFNLAHCHEAAACVVDTVPVGIDVESIGNYDADVARVVMSVAEQEQIERSANPRLAFARLWTMKESLLKMTGEGLATDLGGVLHRCQSQESYTFQTTVFSRFVCTVCRKIEKTGHVF